MEVTFLAIDFDTVLAVELELVTFTGNFIMIACSTGHHTVEVNFFQKVIVDIYPCLYVVNSNQIQVLREQFLFQS